MKLDIQRTIWACVTIAAALHVTLGVAFAAPALPASSTPHADPQLGEDAHPLGDTGILGMAARVTQRSLRGEALDALMAGATSRSTLIVFLDASFSAQAASYRRTDQRITHLLPPVGTPLREDYATHARPVRELASSSLELIDLLQTAARADGPARSRALLQFVRGYEANEARFRGAPDRIDAQLEDGKLLRGWTRHVTSKFRFVSSVPQHDVLRVHDQAQAAIGLLLLVQQAYAAHRDAAGQDADRPPAIVPARFASPGSDVYARWRSHTGADGVLSLGDSYAYDTHTRRLYWISKDRHLRADALAVADRIASDTPDDWPAWQAAGRSIRLAMPATATELADVSATAGAFPGWNPKAQQSAGGLLVQYGMPAHLGSGSMGYWTNQVDRYTTSVLGSHRWTGYVAWDPLSSAGISTKCAAAAAASCPVPFKIPSQGCANKNRPALILRKMTDNELMTNFGAWGYMNPCFYDERTAGRQEFPVHGPFDRAGVLLRTEPLPAGIWRFTPE